MTSSALDGVAFAADVPSAPTKAGRAADIAIQVLDAAVVAMALVDEDGLVRWSNSAFAELSQRPPAQVLGVPLAGLNQRVDPGSDGPDSDVQEWLRPDGTSRWVRIVGAAETDRTGAIMFAGRACAIVQILDLTETVRVKKELERSNRLLTEFAYVASHDLSEPLRVVAGHVALLARRFEGSLDSDAERWVDFAVDGCVRMRQLIDDLLEYSRAGSADIAAHEVDLNAVLARSALSTFGPDHAAVDIRVGQLPTVLGSAPELERVFSNLLSNAAKFARPEIRTKVDIAAKRHLSTWRIAVTDNGIGVEPTYRERIFGLFQRLHRQEDYPGTGIGLAICRKIVESHHGRIWIADPNEPGSRFVIELPIMAGSETMPKGKLH